MRFTRSAPSLRTLGNPFPADAPWRDLPHVAVEICLENVEGVRISARAGADRAELCDIFAAGEEVERRRAIAGPHWAARPDAAPFGLRVMIRPRGGSFVFDSDERRTMIADVRRVVALAREMSDYTRPQRIGGPGGPLPPAVEVGFVVGVLTEEHAIDRGLLRLLVTTADGAPVTFNKAIDAARDPVEAYGDLGGLGVSHVLTAGGADTALEGADVLRGLVSTGGPRVIAAGSVRPENAAQVVERAGVREIHMRCSLPGSTPLAPQRTDEAQVRRAVEVARALPLP